MTCPKCAEPTRVLRTHSSATAIKRDRACLDCQYRFSTLEAIETLDLYSTVTAQCQSIDFALTDAFDALTQIRRAYSTLLNRTPA